MPSDVKRYAHYYSGIHLPDALGEWVKSSDYDALVEVVRELVEHVDCGSQWCVNNWNDDGELCGTCKLKAKALELIGRAG